MTEDKPEQDIILLDLDGTLIKGQTQKVFLEILRSEGIVRFYDYLFLTSWFIFYKFGFIGNPDKIRCYAYKKIANKSVSEIDNLIDNHFYKFQNRIFQESYNIIKKYKNKEAKLVVVSASIEPIVKKISQYLNIEDYLCTKLVTNNLRYTGEIAGFPMYGIEKLNSVKSYLFSTALGSNKLIYFSDHISDLHLMEFVDETICVNPDPKLRKLANKKKWKILFWD